jgi:hypothetical protein
MKGQTAVEYLMTYGWAILIILIVAGVLAYYGIFAPAGFLGPTARGFGQVQVLNPWSVTASTGDVALNLGNRVGEAITITGITYVIDGTTYAPATVTPAATALSSGDNGVYEFTDAPTHPTGSAGDTYTATVTISYTVGSGSTVFTSTGTLSGTYS